jgi:hypothetical protein
VTFVLWGHDAKRIYEKVLGTLEEAHNGAANAQ